MTNWLVTFTDGTCPSCGQGKLTPVCKNLNKGKQKSTIVGYVCHSCNTYFRVKYELNESTNTYEPQALYNDLEIEHFKTQFISKGETK